MHCEALMGDATALALADASRAITAATMWTDERPAGPEPTGEALDLLRLIADRVRSSRRTGLSDIAKVAGLKSVRLHRLVVDLLDARWLRWEGAELLPARPLPEQRAPEVEPPTAPPTDAAQIALLNAIANAGQSIPVAVMAVRAGMSLSTACRRLRQMEQAGRVAHVAGNWVLLQPWTATGPDQKIEIGPEDLEFLELVRRLAGGRCGYKQLLAAYGRGSNLLAERLARLTETGRVIKRSDGHYFVA